MKINKIKLNKMITVMCAALIALTTIIYTAIPAAAEDWTDWTTAPEAAQQLAQAYYEAWSTNEDKSVADYFSDWTDIPISWLKASTAVSSGYILSPVDGLFYYLDESGLLYKDVSRAGGGGRSRVGSSADIEISGETFADIIVRLNEQYAPNAKDYISMRTENRWDSPSDWMSFYADGVFCNQSDWTEVYILPFYYDGSQYYYGITSCHLYQTVETDDDGVNHVYIDYEFTKYFNSSWVDVGRFGGSTNPIDFSSNRYMDISISSTASHFTTYLYSSYEAYLKKEKTGTTLLDWIDETDFAAVYPASGLANSDLSDRQVTYSFGNVVKASEQKDMGYFVSNEPIELYDGGLVTPIDPTKIDPNATITMGGNTIYDYTIINEAGDSTTVYEYVTNNYVIEGDTIINEGDTIIDIDFGSFILGIGTTIETSIKNTFNLLFVPDDDFVETKMDKLKEDFEAKLPVFADLPDIFSELFVDMDEDGNINYATLGDGSQGDPVIDDDFAEDVYPKWEFTINFHGQEMTLTILDFAMFKDVLPYVRLMIMIFVYAVYIYNFVHYLPTLIGNLASMGGVVTAVADIPEPNPYVKVNQYTGEVYDYRM